MSTYKYKHEQQHIPDGLKEAVHQVIGEMAPTRARSISGANLVSAILQRNIGCSHRQVRIAIHDLRRDGVLILSAPGEDGGYWLAENHEQVTEFRERELRSRAMDLLETDTEMEQAALLKFQAWRPIQPKLLELP
jgi:DNA-binding transcriptional regulator PaaX